MANEVARSTARILHKYYDHTALQGRMIDEEIIGTPGLPPACVLRVANSTPVAINGRQPATIPSKRPVVKPLSNYALAQQQQVKAWKDTLSKPVSVQSLAKEAWRNSNDIRSSTSTSVRGSAALSCSVKNRDGYWKGAKIGTKARRPQGNSRNRGRSQDGDHPEVLTSTANIMGRLGAVEWEVPHEGDVLAGSKQHSQRYAHIEQALVRGGLIPRAGPAVMAAHEEFPALDMEQHNAAALMILRDAVDPASQARPMNQVTSQVLGDKVAVVHRLASHSEVLEREMDVYRDAPGHMQQWLAENKQAEIVAARDPIYPPGKDPPQYPFGQPRTRKESPTRRLAEPLPQLKPGQQGHGSIDGFFRGLQALDDYRAAVVPKLRLDGIGHGEDPKQQKRDGGVEYDVGVMYKSELHGRLMEYFHGNGALAEDCLQAVWKMARPMESCPESGMSFAVGQWQEVAVTEDGIRLFPGRPGTTTMDAMLPSHFGPALDHAAQEGRGNIRISSSHVQHVRPFSIPQRATIDEQMALRAAAQSAPVGNHLTPGRLPSTQVSVYGNRPAASSSLADCQLRAVQPLRKKHWHQVLFPSSQPATNRDLEMLEQWIVAMSDHLGIEMTDVLFSDGSLDKSCTSPADLPREGRAPSSVAQVTKAAAYAANHAIESSDNFPASMFEQTFLVYSVAYLELVRQVTIQSVPRGELLLRLWHSFCSLFSALLSSMDKQICQDRKAFEEAYQKGFEDGKMEGDGSVAHWKAKHVSQSKYLDQQRVKWKEEKDRLHQEIAEKNNYLKQMQAELDALGDKMQHGPNSHVTPRSGRSYSRLVVESSSFSLRNETK